MVGVNVVDYAEWIRKKQGVAAPVPTPHGPRPPAPPPPLQRPDLSLAIRGDRPLARPWKPGEVVTPPTG